MINYKALEDTCDKNSELSRSVIDEFLLYYAANQNNLDREMKKKLSPYRHITSRLEESWVNMMKAQYISHRIFQKDGLVNKYLNHSELKRLDFSQMEFLKYQAKHPWRFSFSMVKDNPEKDFYEMIDVFTHQAFLLYSPGITKTLEEMGAILWFNLVSYNGECWQTNGPIVGYKGFEPDDIFFFATELHPNKWFERDEDISADVERNPVPYMMLVAGANYPLTFHKKDQLVHVLAEYEKDTFDTANLKEHFKIEYNDEVYRLMLKEWSTHPHFSVVFYDEAEKTLLLSAMTDRGFKALANRLKHYGYELSNEPDLRINNSMVVTAGDLLKRDIQLNEYDELFQTDVPAEDQETLDKVNTIMRMVIPDINAGKKPDVEAYAKKAGIDMEEAHKIVEHIIGRLNDLEQPPE